MHSRLCKPRRIKGNLSVTFGLFVSSLNCVPLCVPAAYTSACQDLENIYFTTERYQCQLAPRDTDFSTGSSHTTILFPAAAQNYSTRLRSIRCVIDSYFQANLGTHSPTRPYATHHSDFSVLR